MAKRIFNNGTFQVYIEDMTGPVERQGELTLMFGEEYSFELKDLAELQYYLFHMLEMSANSRTTSWRSGHAVERRHELK